MSTQALTTFHLLPASLSSASLSPPPAALSSALHLSAFHARSWSGLGSQPLRNIANMPSQPKILGFSAFHQGAMSAQALTTFSSYSVPLPTQAWEDRFSTVSETRKDIHLDVFLLRTKLPTGNPSPPRGGHPYGSCPPVRASRRSSGSPSSTGAHLHLSAVRR